MKAQGRSTSDFIVFDRRLFLNRRSIANKGCCTHEHLIVT